MDAQKKIFFTTIFFLLLIASQTQSQKRYNVWTFGKNGGINFNTNPPTGFKSKSADRDTTY